MTYKDPVQEFEIINKNVNEAFGNFAKRFGNVFGANKSKTSSHASDILKKHQQDVESGGECAIFRTNPNGLFFSTTGAPDAYFGKNRNHVKNIMDLQISKRELRCYDIDKDPKRIAWLFAPDAVFTAEKIWGKPKKLYFQGIWKSGIFKGILVEPSNFEGGEFHGTRLPTAREIQKRAPVPDYKFIPDEPLQQPPHGRANFEEGLKIIKKMVIDSAQRQLS